MRSIMETLYYTTKGRLMNTAEKFYIYQAQLNNQLNDQHTVQPNAIFSALTRISHP
jgi:hypothetical protein